MYMKKLVKNLLAACMCLSMAFTAVPAVNSGESGAGIFNAQTVQAAKTGLYHEENGWNYYEDGEWSNATTLVKYNGSWWYVEDGSINFDAETLVKYNGSWWYVHDGKVDFNARTLVKYNGIWWYVNAGKIDFNSSTLVKYGDSWFYVSGGQVGWNASGYCSYNGDDYYVRNGVVDFGAASGAYSGSDNYSSSSYDYSYDNDDQNSYTVYVTKTGSKYHSAGCRYLRSSKIAIDVDDAIAQGYDACSVCNP